MLLGTVDPVTVELDYLGHLRRESARFRTVLAGADPSARVPSCPDWDAADLLWHLTEVQAFWVSIVRDRPDDPKQAEANVPERADGYAGLLAQFDQASTALADALADTPDDTALWTWFAADQTAGFVRRRQAHEALIHRLDAELTTGERTPIDAALATDGVAEVFDWMYSQIPPWATATDDGPVGIVRTTDTGGEWLLRCGRLSGTSPTTGTTYADEPTLTAVTRGEPVFQVSGAAADLDAWLWNRPPIGAVTVDGDSAAFVATVRSGVQ